MPVLGSVLRWPLRVVQALIGWVLALLILFEEWGWEPLQRLLARIGELPGFRWMENQLRGLPPYAALAVFLVPTVLLLPVKLLALWFMGQGLVMTGALVIVVAKLVGTAVVARIFTLTRPALLQMPWFARLYDGWTLWKTALLARVRASWVWRQGRRVRERWHQRWQTLKARWSRQ